MFYVFSGNTGGPVALIGYAQGHENYVRQEAKRLMGFYVAENALSPRQAEQVRRMHTEVMARSPSPSPCLCPVCTSKE